MMCANPVERDFIVAEDHPALEGHFPGAPTVPAAMLLDAGLQLAAEVFGGHQSIAYAKFPSPLRPGTLCSLRVELDDRVGGNKRLRLTGTADGADIILAQLVVEEQPVA